MQSLTAFQRDLLIVIAGEEQSHGLGIKDEIDEYYETDVNHGRLYPNLDELTEKGLIEKGALDRRTNYYAITSEGKNALRDRDAWKSQYLDGN